MKSISLLEHIKTIKDFRLDRAKEHPLINIVAISITALLAGAGSWCQVAEFGEAKKEFLSLFLDLSSGIPSHDTFTRFFTLLDPKEFEKFFVSWTSSLKVILPKEIISFDGKFIRRSKDVKKNIQPIVIVSAWANNAQLVLGQVATENKSNEIKALPILLDYLNIKGCIITSDAMGCQKGTVKKIVEKGGDYVISLKGNQSRLHQSAIKYFDSELLKKDPKGITVKTTTDRGHGRIEERRYYTSNNISWLPGSCLWENLQTITAVESDRLINGNISTEKRYYISSLENIDDISLAIRKHWGIENSLHWVLDTCFREDECRKRAGNSGINFNKVRHVALNLLKSEKSTKASMPTKRLKAGWDDSYMLKLLSQFENNSHIS